MCCCGRAEDSCEFKQGTKRNQRSDNRRSLPRLILGKQCTLSVNVFGKRKHTFFSPSLGLCGILTVRKLLTVHVKGTLATNEMIHLTKSSGFMAGGNNGYFKVLNAILIVYFANFTVSSCIELHVLYYFWTLSRVL